MYIFWAHLCAHKTCDNNHARISSDLSPGSKHTYITTIAIAIVATTVGNVCFSKIGLEFWIGMKFLQ